MQQNGKTTLQHLNHRCGDPCVGQISQGREGEERNKDIKVDKDSKECQCLGVEMIGSGRLRV